MKNQKYDEEIRRAKRFVYICLAAVLVLVLLFLLWMCIH